MLAQTNYRDTAVIDPTEGAWRMNSLFLGAVPIF